MELAGVSRAALSTLIESDALMGMSASRKAAIDGKDAAGDPARLVAGEPGGCGRYVFPVDQSQRRYRPAPLLHQVGDFEGDPTSKRVAYQMDRLL